MITFDPLWRTLKSKEMNKGDLQKLTGLSSSTIAKLSKTDDVMLSVVDRICEALQVPIYDVVESVGSSTENGDEEKA
jgi:putative transcriptional regulator